MLWHTGLPDMTGAGTQVFKLAQSVRTIPSLDGIRALSIALVILSHAQVTVGFPGWIPGVIADHGTLGVHIFFVISGFLITTLLLQESKSRGDISLGLFYARRTLRIFPPCYLFLAAIASATWFGIIRVPARLFLFAVTYTVNYATQGIWIVGHLWSLAVEEQFYLVWPLTLKLAGWTRALWIAAILALGAPPFCFALYLVNPELSGRVRSYFPFVADAIAAGCVVAGVLPWLRGQRV